MVIKSYRELGRNPKGGDRVKIIDRPIGMHWNSRMDRYLSSTMTVRFFDEDEFCCKMKEDIDDFQGNTFPGWNWYLDAIEGVVIEEIEDILEDPSVWAHGVSLDALLT